MCLQGLLTITGKIDTRQFWPTGRSDADTVHIIVDKDPKVFRFSPTGKAPFISTSAFFGAKLRGKDVVRDLKSGITKFTVRLQGIDATELHYKLSYQQKPKNLTASQEKLWKKHNKKYQQHFCVRSTLALRALLEQADMIDSGVLVDCMFKTAADEPADVCDCYGRFVGDIEVNINGQIVNINDWLLREGWVVPSFYDSMLIPEIKQKLAVWHIGRLKSGRMNSYLDHRFGTFDSSLIYPSWGKKVTQSFKNNQVTFLAHDLGTAINPKLFRRHVDWYVKSQCGYVNPNLYAFLSEKMINGDDMVLLTDDVLAGHTTNLYSLYEFIWPDGTIAFDPEQIVFIEKDSWLKTAGGSYVTSW